MLLFSFLLACLHPWLPATEAQTLPELIGERIRERTTGTEGSPKIRIGREVIYASVTLPLFYERRDYQPAWTGQEGPDPQAAVLLEAIAGAGGEGLNPAFYHLAKLNRLQDRIQEKLSQERPLDPDQLADFDLLCTDAFLIYGTHLFAGCLNPETIDPEWSSLRADIDLADALEKSLEADDLMETLKRLRPPQPGYIRLRRALAQYRDIVAGGGWPLIPEGPTLHPGDSGDRVMILRRRLRITGDHPREQVRQASMFDETLELAVTRFQWRHGLDPDGVVGPATLGALNVPAEDRLRQLVVNMQRWCWLPHYLGFRHILVNIADFKLDVIETGRIVLSMRVVVGRDYRRTPVFTDQMTHLVLNPYWNIPESIAIEDMLPKIKKDRGYLAAEKIRIFQGWSADARAIDPGKIDWDRVSAGNFPYRLRQDPGPGNALGRVKFMFPNKYNVYLHDTPARQLFHQTERAFSSGCIRVEKPVELAAYLLQMDPAWSRETILAAIENGKERSIPLPEPIAIHLLYWTAWVDQTRTVQFRKDIYDRDRLIGEALNQRPPRS
jgi:murein L,D-transpeptidase YcbB/YkuD